MITNDIVTQTINAYTQAFSGYFSQFLSWGHWLFYHMATIGIVWLCLWRAFDNESLIDALPGFLREFFLIALFYTIMINAAPWLSAIVNTAETMSSQLTHQSIDPASIVQQGVSIANQVLAPVKNSGIATLGFGNLIIGTVYLLILMAFISVALHLAITLLLTTFLVSISGVIMAFGTWTVTRPIAQRAIYSTVGKSIKLLTLYCVIAAGSSVFTNISALLPPDKITVFDIYAWVIAAALLFWLAAIVLPKQMENLFIGD